MKIHLPNSAFLGNINAFLKNIDLSHPDILQITSNEKWISVHPVVLCIVAALGIEGFDDIARVYGVLGIENPSLSEICYGAVKAMTDFRVNDRKIIDLDGGLRKRLAIPSEKRKADDFFMSLGAE